MGEPWYDEGFDVCEDELRVDLIKERILREAQLRRTTAVGSVSLHYIYGCDAHPTQGELLEATRQLLSEGKITGTPIDGPGCDFKRMRYRIPRT